ncbi:MAG: hypothetical protein QM401_01490 [Bacillota bacterium]|nr:hypothetical protein [Bacillota bacterium]HHU62514.1 hypothetical protein [Natronincola sp.]
MKRKLTFLLLIAILLTGCFGRERVMVKPRVDMGAKVAVIYFYNFTDEPMITKDVEDALVLGLSDYYQVVKPIDAERALIDLGLRRGEEPTAKEIVRLGKKLNVDSIVYGEVTGYFEPITTLPVSVIETRVNDDGENEYKWQAGQVTQVMISFSGKVMETKEGRVVYRNRVKGEKEYTSTTTLRPIWWKEGKTPDAWDIPRTHRKDIPDARKKALKQAINQFTADLMPTYVWKKIED